MNGYRNLLVETRDEILWVRINRPQSRNALSRDTLREIADVFSSNADAPLKAAVLTGEGTDAFAAGGDLKELATVRAEEDVAAFFDESSNAVDKVRRFPVLTLAALNGMALGGGAELALACDFRVAAPNAVLGFIQARLGITCGFGGGQDLMRLLGPSRAMATALKARTLSAPEARAEGLVDALADDAATLQQAVMQFLQPMLRQAPQVIRQWKALAMAQREGPPAVQFRQLERASFVHTWMHDDHWAAVNAVTSKWQEKTG